MELSGKLGVGRANVLATVGTRHWPRGRIVCRCCQHLSPRSPSTNLVSRLMTAPPKHCAVYKRLSTLPDLAPPLLLLLLLLLPLSRYRLPGACAQDACGGSSDVLQPR
jgi:hypothetical protein